MIFDTPAEVAAARRVLLDHLPGSPLTQSVEEVRLGRWYDELLANELDSRGVRVVDQAE